MHQITLCFHCQLSGSTVSWHLRGLVKVPWIYHRVKNDCWNVSSTSSLLGVKSPPSTPDGSYSFGIGVVCTTSIVQVRNLVQRTGVGRTRGETSSRRDNRSKTGGPELNEKTIVLPLSYFCFCFTFSLSQRFSSVFRGLVPNLRVTLRGSCSAH